MYDYRSMPSSVDVEIDLNSVGPRLLIVALLKCGSVSHQIICCYTNQIWMMESRSVGIW